MLSACIRSPGPTGPKRVMDLYGGPKGYELIAIPALANISAYRVALRPTPEQQGEQKAEQKEEPKKDAMQIGGATVTAGPTTLPHDSLKKLSAILTDDGTYSWNMAKGCVFDPGVAVRFSGHYTTLDVLFCFNCRELMVYKDGKAVGREDFDARAGELAAIMNGVFPELKLSEE